MQTYFYELVDFLNAQLVRDEVQLTHFYAEESDFVRFNHNAVRQAGAVEQRGLDLTLIRGQRHSSSSVTIAGERSLDRARLSAALDGLRERLLVVPEDPFLLYSTDVCCTEMIHPDRVREGQGSVVDAIIAAGEGRDLVGLFAAGPIQRGFANSFGQRNWFSLHSYHFDWSFYLAGNRAVKSSYAGPTWQPDEFQSKIDQAAEQLEALRSPPRTIQPGCYRVYLAPSALGEITDLLSWGGFGLTAHRTRQTPLLRMIAEGAGLDPSVTLVEDTVGGTTANFDEVGFIKPSQVTLIRAGAMADPLVSPRAAKEYGVATNAAGAGEAPESLVMNSGGLSRSEILGRLDTGIFINNLWYLNYSDRDACRMTGMTRFATFWVENGAIVAPLNVMRFDETLYRMLGDNLLGLTRERDLLMDSNTYYCRSTGSARLPGALIDDFTFTL